MNSITRFVQRFVLALTLLAFTNAHVLAGETITYFHNDVAGSPMLATDSNGLQAWKETYRPYGDTLIESDAAPDNGLWFAGKPYDESTGLSYMGARYYDPVLGRFMGIDPAQVDAEDLHSFNRYSYANNNPYRYVDPDGNFAIAIVPIVIGIKELIFLGSAVLAGLGGAIVYNEVKGSDAPVPTPSDSKGGAAGDKPSTLKPGPNAGDSIPARGPGRDFTPGEREQVNEIGDRTGCHTCGSPTPGTTSGNWVPDHQPPNGVNPEGGEQRLYPHCLSCSRTQGGEVRQAKPPEPPPSDPPQRNPRRE